MTLLNQYVNAVRMYLPKGPQQEDILSELYRTPAVQDRRRRRGARPPAHRSRAGSAADPARQPGGRRRALRRTRAERGLRVAIDRTGAVPAVRKDSPLELERHDRRHSNHSVVRHLNAWPRVLVVRRSPARPIGVRHRSPLHVSILFQRLARRRPTARESQRNWRFPPTYSPADSQMAIARRSHHVRRGHDLVDACPSCAGADARERRHLARILRRRRQPSTGRSSCCFSSAPLSGRPHSRVRTGTGCRRSLVSSLTVRRSCCSIHLR